MLGNGELTKGGVREFNKGFIDIVFSPSIYSKGKAITLRNRNGAVRFLSCGNLQFNSHILRFHREKYKNDVTRKESLHLRLFS